MLTTRTSKEFRVLFLLQFTKELIKNSKKEEFVEIEIQKETPETIHQKIKEREKPNLSLDKEKLNLTKNKLKEPFIIHSRKKILRPPLVKIPETKFPERLRYIKPAPTNLKIDLGKLNPLIQDPSVISLECNGENQKIVVKGRMGIKRTGIILIKQEIQDIIKKFSETSNISRFN